MFNRFMHLNVNSVLIGYNLIGLPSKTHFYTGNIIYTDYAADGRKLQTRYVYDSNEVAVIEANGSLPPPLLKEGARRRNTRHPSL